MGVKVTDDPVLRRYRAALDAMYASDGSPSTFSK